MYSVVEIPILADLFPVSVSSKRILEELVQRYSKIVDLSKVVRKIEARPVPIAYPNIHDVRRRLCLQITAQLVADYQADRSTAVLMRRYRLGKDIVFRVLDQAGTTRHQKG